jgi:cellulose synthase/poly-beta-1,6-N-acetylglucosamine synthase-like glycosyltransferase
VLFIGVLRSTRKPAVSADFTPTVSVVVAAMNEEANIGGCIESLLKLDYPKDKLEVLLVNDRSTDRTKEIMLGYCSNNSVLKYVEITSVAGSLKGKTNALAVSIKQAKGEIIFTTDADIQVKASWVKDTLKYYDDKTAVVSGYSTIEPRNAYWGIQSLDWLYLLGIAAGGDGLDHPISCLGNNMSYRKEAYDKVGGYEKIKFSVTEDFMLLQTIVKNTGWKSQFPVDSSMMNRTYPCLTWRELYRQKKRWGKGGLDSHSAGMIAALVIWLAAVSTFVGWIAGWKFYLIFLAAKTLIDAIYIMPSVKEFKMWKAYLYILFFELYVAVYMIVTPLAVLLGGRVVWKEQKI